MADKEINIILRAEDRATQVIQKVQQTVSGFGGSVEQVGNKMVAWGEKLDASARAMQRTGRVLSIQLTAPIVAFGKSAVDAAVTADTAYRQLQKVFDGTATQINTQLIPAAQELALTWGVSKIEIMGVMEEFAAAGFNAIEIIEATTKAIEVERIGNLDLAQSQSLVLSLMQTFGLRGRELTEVIADLNAVEDESAARFDDLSFGIGRFGSIMELANVPIREQAALLGVLQVKQDRVEVNSRALRTITKNIIAPTEKVNELFQQYGITTEKLIPVTGEFTKTIGANEEEMKRIGKRMETVTGQMRDYEAGSRGANLSEEDRKEKLEDLKATYAALESQMKSAEGQTVSYHGTIMKTTGEMKPMSEVLLEMADRWDKLTDAERANFAAVVGGTNFIDQFSAVMNDLSNEQSEYRRILEETEDPQKNMARLTAQLALEQGSAAVQFGRLNEKFRQFKEFVGNDVIPIIIPLLNKLSDLTVKFTNLDRSTREFIVKAAMIAAAIGPALIVIGMMKQGIGALVKTVGLASGAFLKLFLFLLAHPLVALAVAITAVTTAIGLLIIKSDIWKNKAELVAGAEERLRDAQNRLTTSTDLLKDAYDRVIDTEINVEATKLAVERATRNVDEMTKTYGADALETREAQLQLEQATRFLETAVDDQKEAEDELIKKNEEYDKSVDEVKTAQGELQEANEKTETSFGRIRNTIQGLIDKFKEWISVQREHGGGGGGESFQHGGVVPGPIGRPVPAIVHAGERVVPRAGADVNPTQGGGVTVNFYGSIAMDSPQRVYELADRISKLLGRQNELATYGIR